MAETIDLSSISIDPACAARLPAAFALRKFVLPLSVVGGKFCVAMPDPDDAQTVALVAREVGMEARAYGADPARLRAELLRLYGERRGTAPSAAASADDPVAAVDNVLRSAALRHASDVHFDPTGEGLRVRFRADGELEEVTVLPFTMQAAVTSRLKVMAGLDIAERRAPQDGGFTWRAQGVHGFAPLDVRMATLPVRHGERITLRLLETDGGRMTLDGLGFSAADRATFESVLSSPHGLVLLTGPTGSGKTTTLYAAICLLLSRRALNVLTVEDPIEYEIPGVAQAEVDSADKVNFEKALRSLLRHDPDVVMIGEIRDSQSLDIAVKAALTGHLVLSTLHTNDAVSAVTRLEDMGLAPHLVAATLRLSAAQRLVRALCPHCRAGRPMTAGEAAALGFRDCADKSAFSPVGCLRCAGRGYRGRMGLFELFMPDRECASMISASASETELREWAAGKGMKTLLDDAREKCLLGATTVNEAARAVGGGL